MKLYTVGILGATGAVGQEMMRILEERDFPVGKLVPLASARSVGKTVKFKGQDVAIELACDEAFEGIDIVLGAAENDIAERFAPAIVKAGAVFVDNSSAFRLNPDVPLVVPEINPDDAKKHKGIISNPNCSTIITCTAVNALNAISPSRAWWPPPTRPSPVPVSPVWQNLKTRSPLCWRASPPRSRPLPTRSPTI